MTPAQRQRLHQHLARIRVKAEARRRERYIARLKARLAGMKTPGQIWRAAYFAGYRACHQSWLNKIRRGDVALLKARPIRKSDAA